MSPLAPPPTLIHIVNVLNTYMNVKYLVDYQKKRKEKNEEKKHGRDSGTVKKRRENIFAFLFCSKKKIPKIFSTRPFSNSRRIEQNHKQKKNCAQLKQFV